MEQQLLLSHETDSFDLSLCSFNDLTVTSSIMLCRSNRQLAAPEMVARCWKILVVFVVMI